MSRRRTFTATKWPVPPARIRLEGFVSRGESIVYVLSFREARSLVRELSRLLPARRAAREVAR